MLLPGMTLGKTDNYKELWLHLDSESSGGFWLWCLKPTTRP